MLIKYKKCLQMCLLLAAVLCASSWANPPASRKILVILSSVSELELKDGKKYPTGYYFNELTIPVRKLMESGFEVEFANASGSAPVMDAHSLSATYFGNDGARFQDFKNFHDSLEGLKNPRTLKAAITGGLNEYVGLFIPGGHAPMQDLIEDKDLNTILGHFHKNNKVTALICHGPVSLIAAMPKAQAFVKALNEGRIDEAKKLSKSWPYMGYRMTVFSTPEEQVAEGEQLAGKVRFYPALALETAGADVQKAEKWQSFVIRDRELITGQNPASDEKLAEMFIAALDEKISSSKDVSPNSAKVIDSKKLNRGN